jgi:hypothetical protein
MPKKIIKKPETRTGDDISLAEKGDYCYYLSTSNKSTFAEIKNVRTENEILILQIICQVDYKFMWVPASICAFDPKELKGKKRSDLYPVFK